MSDATIATVVTGFVTVVTILVGFLTTWVKLKYGEERADKKATEVERKVDANTALTRAGTERAATNANVAASAAGEAVKKVEEIVVQLNGRLEDRIIAIVKAYIEPMTTALHQHAIKDDENMAEIRYVLDELRGQMYKG